MHCYNMSDVDLHRLDANPWFNTQCKEIMESTFFLNPTEPISIYLIEANKYCAYIHYCICSICCCSRYSFKIQWMFRITILFKIALFFYRNICIKLNCHAKCVYLISILVLVKLPFGQTRSSIFYHILFQIFLTVSFAVPSLQYQKNDIHKLRLRIIMCAERSR